MINTNMNAITNVGVQGKQASEQATLGMQDFLSLMVAQMRNQDVMNPMDNTEFVAQLAQFSSLQAMTDMASATKQSQVVSLVGKNIVVSDPITRTDIEGVVESVIIKNGSAKLMINDIAYEFESVKEIREIKLEEPVIDEMYVEEQPIITE